MLSLPPHRLIVFSVKASPCAAHLLWKAILRHFAAQAIPLEVTRTNNFLIWPFPPCTKQTIEWSRDTLLQSPLPGFPEVFLFIIHLIRAGFLLLFKICILLPIQSNV